MNIKIIELENAEGIIIEHVIIDRGNDEYTSMAKSIYDEQQKALKDAAN